MVTAWYARRAQFKLSNDQWNLQSIVDLEQKVS